MSKTDRSRMAAMLNCPRLRYLNYEHDGLGLQRVSQSLPLVYGIATHLGMAELRAGVVPEVAIQGAVNELRMQFAKGMIPTDTPEDLAFFVDEQVRLLEGTLWAWVRVRLPFIQSEYEVVAIEREINWQLGPDITDMVRCDVLERRRADGLLFYREYKTTGSRGDEQWQKQFEHNSQLLLNVQAIEETLGERVDGVLIEGILKGYRAKDKAKTSPFYGKVIQNSPFTYGYTDGKIHQTEYSRSMVKTPTWKLTSAKGWVYDIMTEAECAAQFAPLPPIRPRPDLMERFRVQMVAQEGNVVDKLEVVRSYTDPEARRIALDIAFPMNDDHCFRYFGRPCSFEPLCFDPQVAEDPIASGLYQIREPHHPLESED